ncbi:hypothetical protein HPO96_31150 [Kribbella sandramycini]|uniref:Uncharacterized protein n=1 Tax=Kribbella sandramycini TaxID=60450 RepID=A0A7Y4L7Q7_9ACTN|nr:hypothetical protein [Kribbella sandramycini]MBB6566994.1 hypothetical protein [Kribbella sandramycini]NOL44716.1 hypothetical protein [Kribbella sandramycini]
MGISPRDRRRRSWALYGALILIVLNVLLTLVSGPGEQSDSIIFGSLLAAPIGLACGFGLALLRERRDR